MMLKLNINIKLKKNTLILSIYRVPPLYYTVQYKSNY